MSESQQMWLFLNGLGAVFLVIMAAPYVARWLRDQFRK